MPDGRGGGRVSEEARPATVLLKAITFSSSTHVLKACNEDVGWRNAGTLCAEPEWTPEKQRPISHIMGKTVRLVVPLGLPEGAPRPEKLGLRGDTTDGVRFAREDTPLTTDSSVVEVTLSSLRPLPKRVAKLDLGIHWHTSSGANVLPSDSSTTVYVTMGRPRDDEQEDSQEDGVTLKRMDRAVSWIEQLGTLRPHSIVRGLMSRFPYYSLRPSPKVPREYHQPSYFNEVGGAWPMSDWVEESGECQAIVRLLRGMLRQVGVPGEARTLVVWADPEVERGRKALSAYWDDEGPRGLSRMKRVRGQVWFAALADGPMEEGKEYPASHTLLPSGASSPGLNRFEACLEFTHEGVTRLYGGGAGVFRTKQAVLKAFWGLVWVSPLPDEGFRVEEIVTQYQ